MSDAPQQLVDAALAASEADGCLVVVAEHSETNLRWANTTLTTNGQMAARSVTVISTFGAAAGVLSRAVTGTDEVVELVRAADRAAREADPSEDAAPLVAPEQPADAGGSGTIDWDAPATPTGIGVFDPFARELGAQFPGWRGGDRALFGFAEHQMTSYFLGSSTGLRRRFDQPTGRLEINGKADGERSVWDGVASRDFTDVDIAAVCAGLERRLEWARNRVELPPGRYDTILPPSAVADFMIYALEALDAREAAEGRSVFSGPDGTSRVGEQVANLPLTLRSDPGYPGLQCPDFELSANGLWLHQAVFDNGRPCMPTAWIDRGRLAAMVGTRAWSANSGTAVHPFIDNLVLDGAPDPKTQEQMIASTESGLLLTSLWYIREVDPQTLLLTGLTRDGVFLIENGEVVGAVNNFRFNESPIDLLARATEASEAEPTLSREWSDYFTRSAMPALRIPDFNMSTVSQAN